MRKLNILFRVSGGKAPGKELGNGHIFRSIHLAHHFKNHNIFFLLDDFGGAKRILFENGFNKIIITQKNINLKNDIIQTKKIIKNKKIDVLINDVYKAKNEYFKQLRGYTKTVLITDLKKFQYSADLVINGFIGFKNQKIVLNDGRLVCLGPKYQILNHRFSKIKKTRKKYDLLVTFGGFDENNLTEIFLEQLIKSKTKIKTRIIHGPSSKKTQRIKEIEKKFPQLFTLIPFGDMYKEISLAKFGLCSGGITTYEFATLDVPFAILSQVKHQTITAKVWENIGMALNLGLNNKNTHKKIVLLLENIEKIRLNKNITTNLYLNGNGGTMIHEEILKLLD
jgi:spore coat polysaccharide biosynthesis predicted glycosyltransferase SpsG